MELLKKVARRYLWVHTLCIVQDDMKHERETAVDPWDLYEFSRAHILCSLFLSYICLDLNLDLHLRKGQSRNRNCGPDGSVTRNPLLQHFHRLVVRKANVDNVVASDTVNVLPSSQASSLKHPVDILKGELHLAWNIVGIKSAGLVPTTLAGAFDNVSENDSLGVVAQVAMLLAGAFFVEVLERGHGLVGKLEPFSDSPISQKRILGGGMMSMLTVASLSR